MEKSTRVNTVKSRANTVKSRFRPFVVAATAGVVKQVARETSIAPRTIEDIRCHERLGSVETFLLLAQNDPRLAAEVKRFLDEKLIRQSLGPLAEIYPDAVERALRGGQ